MTGKQQVRIEDADVELGVPAKGKLGVDDSQLPGTHLKQTSRKQVAVNQARSRMLKIAASQLFNGFAQSPVPTQTIADAIQPGCDSFQHFGQRSIRPERNIENMLMVELPHRLVAEGRALTLWDGQTVESRCVASQFIQLRSIK